MNKKDKTQELSRQRKWQLKKVALGLCEKCGHRSIAQKSKTYCMHCFKQEKVYRNSAVYKTRHAGYSRITRAWKSALGICYNCSVKKYAERKVVSFVRNVILIMRTIEDNGT